MSEMWKQWEGRTVDARFPLQRYLGGSDHSAVFLTATTDSKQAAIKLIPTDPASAEKQLLRWKITGEVTHPNLIRIFAMGRCELDGTELVYLVMEYAEENLAQILPERALTAEEVRAMLPPILEALQSVHARKYVLGHIQPSNILAIGDQVKQSSDALSVTSQKAAGGRALSVYDPPEAATGVASTASDVWQLGMTLIEVLTQDLPVWDRTQPGAPKIPSTIPEPFRGIAQHCLEIDAGKRWTVGQISKYLEANQPPPKGSGPASVNPAQAAVRPATPEQTETKKTTSSRPTNNQEKTSPKWPYWLALAAIVVLAIVLIARSKSSPNPAGQSMQSQPDVKAENSTAPGSAQPMMPPASSTGPDSSTDTGHPGVVKRVTPQVSSGARRTIHGTIMVRVKVTVDPAGNVEKTNLESGRGSKYFSRIALEAAREWKFSQANADDAANREWNLQFAFSRSATEVSALKVRR